MANLHLVTGYAGVEHITSDDQGSFNAAIMGTGQFVLERGNQFAASIISNNEVKVADGDALMQGRHIRMKENTYVNLNFDNGLQGYNRIDLIVIRYTKDSTTDIETANLVVIKGTPVEGDPAVPDHMVGDLINEHDLVNDMVLYKVPFNGLNIQPLEAVFDTVPTWETLKNQVLENIAVQFDAFVENAMQQITNAEKPLVSNIDDMLLIENYGEYAADAKTVGEKITQLYSDLGGFVPIIDESTGKITGYTTTVGGADTVFPFSDIEREKLIQALAYSGLGLTLQSTPEQIYNALLQRFPQYPADSMKVYTYWNGSQIYNLNWQKYVNGVPYGSPGQLVSHNSTSNISIPDYFTVTGYANGRWLMMATRPLIYGDSLDSLNNFMDAGEYYNIFYQNNEQYFAPYTG